ncbi:MAG: type II secretion system F family protein [Candidatus Aenigmatarchaeota archaeon]
MKLKLKLGKMPANKTTLISVVVALLLIIVGLIMGDMALLGNLVIIAIFAVVLPLFFHRYSRFNRIKALEEQFPNFVRDLADSVRSGMSFKEAMAIASRANYGKLTEEIKLMHNRLSWDTPMMRVWDIFGKRVKESKLITEALNIMKESQLSGGNVAATLDSIARDMVMFKEVEAERQSLVHQHVLIMYGIFFMFLGIAIMIIFVMVPMIKTQPQVAVGALGVQFTDPCAGVAFFPCNFFQALGVIFAMPAGITLYYTALFFTVVLIQGFFTGLIAGQLGENSVIAGTKHSLIMVTVALGVFLFMAKTGMFPV